MLWRDKCSTEILRLPLKTFWRKKYKFNDILNPFVSYILGQCFFMHKVMTIMSALWKLTYIYICNKNYIYMCVCIYTSKVNLFVMFYALNSITNISNSPFCDCFSGFGIYIHTYIYIYIHTHTHTYIHIYIHIQEHTSYTFVCASLHIFFAYLYFFWGLCNLI